MKTTVANCGALGAIKDLSSSELPIGAWTDALNVRFLDGYAGPFLGHGQVYNTPAFAPQFVMPINVAGARYWLYATAAKQYVVTNTGGVTTHTDITHVTARTGVVNQWSGFVFGGIPILNVGDTSRVPMYWDQNLANKFVDLTSWPAGEYCTFLGQYKNFIIAINTTEAGVRFPYKFKWSSPAVPGALPSNYDETVSTSDSGEFDISEGQDPCVFGLGLKSQYIVYKESSTFAIDFVGGAFIFNNRKVFGMSGILNRNCAVEFDAFHFVVTGSDIVIHDGYNASSVLDKKARRHFFQNIDVDNKGMAFCAKNPFLNEILVFFPSIGATSCDRILVYNFVDKTVMYRTAPNVNHAAYGPVDNSLGGNWNQDSDSWDSDLTAWNGPDFTPDTARVMMASADTKLFLLDAAASFDGTLPSVYMERRGLSLDMPDRIKCVTGIRPKITGNVGSTVTVKIGVANTPYDDPVYTTMTYTIGTTIQCDCMVSGRYIAVWIGSGTAAQWRLDSYELFYKDGGAF
ncbi:MAG: hypothetical protein V4633_13555 [Pseudomonadota bacterium]